MGKKTKLILAIIACFLIAVAALLYSFNQQMQLIHSYELQSNFIIQLATLNNE